MQYFDLHCDTLVECLNKKASLLHNDLHVSVEKGAHFAPVSYTHLTLPTIRLV